MPILGMLIPFWTWFRGSKIALYGALALGLLALFLLYRRRLRREGFAQAVNQMRDEAYARMQENRRINREIRTWPAELRADKLRQLSARTRRERL